MKVTYIRFAVKVMDAEQVRREIDKKPNTLVKSSMSMNKSEPTKTRKKMVRQ